MRRRDILFYSAIFLGLIVCTADVVAFQLTGSHLTERGTPRHASTAAVTCSSKPAATRPDTADPQLRALAEYESACQSAFASDLMIFSDMPISVPDAQAKADAMTVRLKTFSAAGITPMVVVEPDSKFGLLDFKEYASGMYDDANRAYFDRLQANGITDDQLGIWIPFPEPQQPTWNNNADPDDYATNINRYFTVVRSHYSHAKTAILLDSQAGSPGASQLLAYTRLIDPSLVTIVGLQGFPWYPADSSDTRKPITSASQFAPAAALEDIAQSLGTKQVLLNVGTFRHKITTNGGELSISSDQRRATLSSISGEVSYLHSRGYQTTVNVFAENKLKAKEGTDWSYWEAGRYKDAPGTGLFTNFIRSLLQDKATVGLYDSRS